MRNVGATTPTTPHLVVVSRSVVVVVVVILAACSGSAPVNHEQDRSAPPPAPAKPADPTPRSCLLDGVSPCVSRAPISVTRGALAWSDSLRAYGGENGTRFPLGVTECRWVAELSEVLLCGSYDTATLNAGLTRAAMFIEGLRSKAGVIPPRGDAFFE